MTGQNEPSLHILSGLHAGATFALGGSKVQIGNGIASDLILADDGVCDDHAALEWAGGRLQLTALAEGVAAAGRPVAVGATVTASLPFAFELAEVRLRCDGPPADPAAVPSPAMARRSVPRSWIAVGGGAGCLLAMAALAIPASIPALGDTRAEAPVNPAPSATAGSAAAFDRVPDPALVQQEVGAKLAEAGLTALQVSISGNVVTVSGQLDPSALAQWRAIQAWADQRFGRTLLLVPNVTIKAERSPVIAIEGVWNGPQPNVVVRGERYALGASLPDGSRITVIEPNRIVVEKNGRTHALSF